MSVVQQTVEVQAPLHTCYEQLAAVENYPRFMSGVRRVVPVGDGMIHWVLDVQGRTREFDARVVERAVDRRIAWASVDGPRLAETLTLRPVGDHRTRIVAELDADIAYLMPDDRHGPETLARRLRDDLDTFKALVEGGRAAVPSPAAVAARLRGRGAAGGAAGASAPMGGNVVATRDVRGDGVVNEEDRGSAGR